MNALSILRQLPSNRAEVNRFIDILRSEILDGNNDPLQVAVMLKAIGDVFAKLRTDDELDEFFLNEASKYPEKSFEIAGARIAVAMTGVKYDFPKCQDSTWLALQQEMTELKERIKDRENTLKAHKEKWVDAETGEEIYPVQKYGKEKITVTLL